LDARERARAHGSVEPRAASSMVAAPPCATLWRERVFSSMTPRELSAFWCEKCESRECECEAAAAEAAEAAEAGASPEWSCGACECECELISRCPSQPPQWPRWAWWWAWWWAWGPPPRASLADP
jgi:hypothetical protein